MGWVLPSPGWEMEGTSLLQHLDHLQHLLVQPMVPLEVLLLQELLHGPHGLHHVFFPLLDVRLALSHKGVQPRSWGIKQLQGYCHLS